MPRISKETQEKQDNKLISKATKKPAKPGVSSSKQSKEVDSQKKLKDKSLKSDSKTNKKDSSEKTISKKSTSKRTTSKKTSPKKSNSIKKTPKKEVSKKQLVNVLEYYDLPYRYNKTVVRVLAQTPKILFVYWDISDDDKKLYVKQYGENFFEETSPVLIIHNTTMNYTFEIEINDFANCWYFNINDEKSEYLVELGRRPKRNDLIPNDYLYITSSNKVESPNGHILFEKDQKVLYFRNVKTHEGFSKDIANLEFIKYIGRIYNIYDIYKQIYKEDETLDINNPTSTFK